MTTREQISEWFDEGVNGGASNMIIMVDDFDYEDYPVYVKSHQDVFAVANSLAEKAMQRIIEVYDLKVEKEVQLDQNRAFNYNSTYNNLE